jgi:hypothetical protein
MRYAVRISAGTSIIPTEVLRGFTQSFQKVAIWFQIMTWPITSNPFHYVLIILTFDAMYSEYGYRC